MPTQLVIIGNACADPEVRTTTNGTKIVELRVASSDGKDKTSFWTTKFLGTKAGDVVEKHVKKGSFVMVSGSAEEESWESKDGQKKSKIVCLAQGFNFVGGKPDGAPKAETKPAAKVKEEQVDPNEPPF